MGLQSFNEESEKPWFISKMNQLVPHTWQIFEFRPDKDNYEPVGEYIVLDLSEPIEITEKRVGNLISILNRRERFVDFNSLTKTRILYNIIDETPESDKLKVVFRAYDGSGVSIENAVLTIEKGVFHEKSAST